ncbi:uncharacterized protein [Littorina saxatilis]|uniref:Uncharacterized protein n=1 Tax=Littorina saxatilis TaxID=31220 RepID=A0AAN9BLK4_9CAEN
MMIRLYLPDNYRPHEAEDVGQISPAMFSGSRDPKDWKNANIHQAHSLSRQLGSRLARHVYDPKESLNSLKFRLETFNHGGWHGACAEEMARAGLYFNSSTGFVQCYMCHVQFRDLNQPGICPWQQHGEIAPKCCQLKRYGCRGIKPTAPAVRRRINSASAVDDINSP